MASKEQLDTAMNAVMPLVNADLEKGENDPRLGFFKQRVDQAIEAHRADIVAGVRRYLNAGLDAVLSK